MRVSGPSPVARGLVAYGVAAVALGATVAYGALVRRGVRRVASAPVPPPAPAHPVAVVVAARDEAGRIEAAVDALARQTHSALDVVVVDDGSTDATPDRLAAWAARDSRVRTRLNPGPPGKKGALAAGIDAAGALPARPDAVLLTDADCAPPPGWAAALAGYLAADAPKVVVGYAPYRRRRGLLNRLARYETLVTGALTAAAVGLGRPYMAVGRNLGYHRTAFAAVRFDGHGHVLSGDDDLFVQAVTKAGAARVVHAVGPATYVPSEAPATWAAWVRQKRRHLSDGRHYPPALLAHLVGFHAAGLVLLAAPLALGRTGWALAGARLALAAWTLAPAARLFGERDLVTLTPLLEPLHAVFGALAGPVSNAARLRRW